MTNLKPGIIRNRIITTTPTADHGEDRTIFLDQIPIRPAAQEAFLARAAIMATTTMTARTRTTPPRTQPAAAGMTRTGFGPASTASRPARLLLHSSTRTGGDHLVISLRTLWDVIRDRRSSACRVDIVQPSDTF